MKNIQTFYLNWEDMERDAVLPTSRLHNLYHAFNEGLDKDAFSKGQLYAKDRVVSLVQQYGENVNSIYVCGAWYGLLPFLLPKNKYVIMCNDIDGSNVRIAKILNNGIHKEFDYTICDMCDINYESNSLVVNTSFEHVTNYVKWMAKIKTGTITIVQSNNMFEIPGHVNCSPSIEKFLDLFVGFKCLHAEKHVYPVNKKWERYIAVLCKEE